MPTYHYRCKKCGHHFKQFQNITDSALKKCPECKGAVERLISTGVGIIFKGSGFYQTDYKKDSSKSDKPAPCEKTDSCSSCEKNA